MKIDRPGGELGVTRLHQTSKGPEPSRTNGGQRTSGEDRVVLSPAASQGQPAPAADAPAIRADLVARMRALGQAGALGRDAGRLADAILDRLVNKP